VGAVANGAKKLEGFHSGVVDFDADNLAARGERRDPEGFLAGTAALGEGTEGDGSSTIGTRACAHFVVFVVEHVGYMYSAFDERRRGDGELADASIDENEIRELALRLETRSD
jgi:hypothetical protein